MIGCALFVVAMQAEYVQQRVASLGKCYTERQQIDPRCSDFRKQFLLLFDDVLRDAPVEQIAAVPGIGPSLAARIKATLEA